MARVLDRRGESSMRYVIVETDGDTYLVEVELNDKLAPRDE